MAAEKEAKIWGVLGASGTGKGVWIKHQLGKLRPSRLVVWDFKKEYEQFSKRLIHGDLKAVEAAMEKAGGAGPAVIRYRPAHSDQKKRRREFEGLCAAVQWWQDCTFVAEELANVTTPSWSPAAWLEMTTSGRHDGVHIIGTSQTPALVDKTFLGNCTLIHAGPLRQYDHRMAVARSMDIDEGRLARLVKFQWIEKEFDTGRVSTGFTYPGGKRPPGAPTPQPDPESATGTPA